MALIFGLAGPSERVFVFERHRTIARAYRARFAVDAVSQDLNAFKTQGVLRVRGNGAIALRLGT